MPYDSVAELRDFALREKIDFTFVYPELPLVNGIVDEFQKHNLKIFTLQNVPLDLEGSFFLKKNLCKIMASEQPKLLFLILCRSRPIYPKSFLSFGD